MVLHKREENIMMLVIGSRALHHAGLIDFSDIQNSDWDFISTSESWENFKSQMHGIEVEVQTPDVRAFKCMHGLKETYFESYIFEFYEDNSNVKLAEYAEQNIKKDNLARFYWATPEMCLAIKMSHRFKKNNPFFRKTMQHINFLRNKDVTLTPELEEIMVQRQKETLSYAHPNLNVSKDAFFKDDIYTLDHDSIHEAVALANRPAYTFYMKDGSEVLTSKEKFFALPEEIRLAGVYEEACVLALERSQVPNDFTISPRQSFMIALEKVCTSITSGWFREYAWENYTKVLKIYATLGEDNYVKRFKENQDKIRPFTRGE